MNPLEVAQLIRGVKALCPAQKWDEASPEMWHKVLANVTLADAKDAALELGRQQAFIAPAEIHAKATQLRQARVARVPMPCPNTVPGISEGDEIRAIERAIGEGLIANVEQAYAYERWGGSLHLAFQARAVPALEAAPVVTDPAAVEAATVQRFISGSFQHLPPAIADVLARRRPPGTSVACPACHAAPNRPCTTQRRRRGTSQLSHPHPSRMDAWATQTTACPDCAAAVGESCTEYGSRYPGGAHRARIEAATAATA